jgi:hypothetical protein
MLGQLQNALQTHLKMFLKKRSGFAKEGHP